MTSLLQKNDIATARIAELEAMLAASNAPRTGLTCQVSASGESVYLRHGKFKEWSRVLQKSYIKSINLPLATARIMFLDKEVLDGIIAAVTAMDLPTEASQPKWREGDKEKYDAKMKLKEDKRKAKQV